MIPDSIKFVYHNNGHCTVYENGEDLGLVGLIQGYGPLGVYYARSSKPISNEIRKEALDFIRESEGWCRSDCKCNKCIVSQVHEL